MKIRILSPGKKLPGWINEGFAEYAKRMPNECKLELIELNLAKRAKKNYSTEQAKQEELAFFQKALNKSEHVVALHEKAKSISTVGLAQQLEYWQGLGKDIAILIGGPDGLAPELLQLAEQKFKLSDLTLPHGLVRVLLAEQLYRAHTIVIGHPYHRA